MAIEHYPSFTVITTGVIPSDGKSLLSIVNTSSVNMIKILNAHVFNTATGIVTGMTGVVTLMRCTGHSSGTLVTTIEKMDNVDTLDAGITVRTGATITGESINMVRRVLINTSTLGDTLGTASNTSGTNQIFPFYRQSQAQIKPLTLRQNEGCTIKFAGVALNGSIDLCLDFLVMSL